MQRRGWRSAWQKDFKQGEKAVNRMLRYLWKVRTCQSAGSQVRWRAERTFDQASNLTGNQTPAYKVAQKTIVTRKGKVVIVV